MKHVRPIGLNDAVHHAIELEALYSAEQKKKSDKGIPDVVSVPKERITGRYTYSTGPVEDFD